MKAVMAEVPQDLLDDRRRRGADRWDEMWEGVLHMPPMPNRHHQDLVGALETWLRTHWARTHGGRVYHEINVSSVGGWPRDYRVPDLVILQPDRYFIDRNEYFEGAPSVVVEIVSPGDESYEKLSFYKDLGVPEVWLIERDSKKPDVRQLVEGTYVEVPPHADGWVTSPATCVQLRASDDGFLRIRTSNVIESEEALPGRT